jgi:hypothetical protein
MKRREIEREYKTFFVLVIIEAERSRATEIQKRKSEKSKIQKSENDKIRNRQIQKSTCENRMKKRQRSSSFDPCKSLRSWKIISALGSSLSPSSDDDPYFPFYIALYLSLP